MLRVSCVSSRLAKAFTDAGLEARCHVVGIEWLSVMMSCFVSAKTLFRLSSWLAHPLFNVRLVHSVRSGDIVWLYADGQLINSKFDAAFEQAVLNRGGVLVFHLPDAWPLANRMAQEGCDRRIPMAQLTAAVTPQLAQELRRKYPSSCVEVCEEAIDTDLVAPPRRTGEGLNQELPLLAINSLPHKLDEVGKLTPVLEHIYALRPFRLRIVSGDHRPNLPLSMPWEWSPYNQRNPTEGYHDVSAALVWYGDSPYDRCKGNYKVKTFMAMGIPVITNNAGYNQVLVDNQVDGFLVNGEDDWERTILRVLDTPASILQDVGAKARMKIVARYSYPATVKAYVKVLQKHFPAELEKCRISTEGIK
jgi:hypothetical protein